MEVLGCLIGLLKIKAVVDVSICYGVFQCISKSGMVTCSSLIPVLVRQRQEG